MKKYYTAVLLNKKDADWNIPIGLYQSKEQILQNLRADIAHHPETAIAMFPDDWNLCVVTVDFGDPVSVDTIPLTDLKG